MGRAGLAHATCSGYYFAAVVIDRVKYIPAGQIRLVAGIPFDLGTECMNIYIYMYSRSMVAAYRP